MINYRIIDPRHDLPDVLLRLNSGDNGIEVSIEAIGYKSESDSDDWFFIDVVIFDSIENARRFIRDYSVESAIEWCEEMDALYENPNPTI